MKFALRNGYSFKILAIRLAIAYGIGGGLTWLATRFDPQLVEAVRPHVEELATIVFCAVLGVDVHAFKGSKASKPERMSGWGVSE